MNKSIEMRLRDAGITLPETPAPAANYVPFVRTGKLIHTAGQIPFVQGELSTTGKLGGALDIAAGQAAARLCAVNVLALARDAAGDLDRIGRLVKITVFVASDPDFHEQHLVANGASDLFVDVLGEAGRHARSAVGVPCLPFDAPVEVEAIFEVV